MLYVFFSCSTNRKTRIIDILNVERWNIATIDALKNELGLDTIIKTIDSCCWLSGASLYADLKNIGFEEGIKNRLCYREEFLQILENRNISLNIDSFYIEERSGFNTGGYNITIVPYINRSANFYFHYDFAKKTFILNEDFNMNEYLTEDDKYPTFMSKIEDGVLFDLSIVTKIIIDKTKNDAKFKIIYIYAH